MNNNYTVDYFNKNSSTASGWGNGTLYNTSYSNYSKSLIRDITNNIYTALNSKLDNFSNFVKSPSEAGSTWQKTQTEDIYVYRDSSSSTGNNHKDSYYYYAHHNGLDSYSGMYTGWANSNWNTADTPYNDEFWIPSYYEVCNTSDHATTSNGWISSQDSLWGLTAADRGFISINNDKYTIDGSGSTSDCWLRSGYSYYSSHALRLRSSGSADNNLVSVSYGVRPACHLSLSELRAAAAIPSTITLDQQSGSGGTESVVATPGSAMPSITKPTRIGYTFGGYYTGTNGSGTQYYNTDGTSAQNWNISGDTILYAYWIINKYTISIVSNNTDYGTILNNGGIIDYGTIYTAGALPKKDCAFLYWIDSTNPTEPIYDNPLTITATATKTYTAYFTDSLIDGVCITSNFGGSAEILQTVDTTTLADSDTLTLIARLRYNGYQFDGWYIQGETTAFSTNMSVSVQYGLIKKKVVIAKFSKISNEIIDKTNTDTNNTNEFL